MRTRPQLAAGLIVLVWVALIVSGCGDEESSADSWAEAWCDATLTFEFAGVEADVVTYHEALVALDPPPTETLAALDSYQELIDSTRRDVGSLDAYRSIASDAHRFYALADQDIHALRPGFDVPSSEFASSCEEFQFRTEGPLVWGP